MRIFYSVTSNDVNVKWFETPHDFLTNIPAAMDAHSLTLEQMTAAAIGPFSLMQLLT